MNKKLWKVVLALALIGGLGYAAYGTWSGHQAMAQESDRETASVRRGTLATTVEGTGSLAPRADVDLAFLTGGPVAGVFVEEGEAVEAGRPLLQLETDELESEVAQARARVSSAEAQLAQLLADPLAEDVAELEANLEAAQAQVSAAAARRDRTMAGPSQTEIADAQAQAASAEADHREALIAYDTTDEDDEDAKEQAHYDLWAAEVALEAARTQLGEVQAGPDGEDVRAAQADVTEAVKRRDAAQAQLDLALSGATRERIDNAEAVVDEAQVALDRALLQLERATLSAPCAGTVVALDVNAGEIAGAGQTVIVLHDTSSLEVQINVDETDVAKVSVGQEARVTLDAFPEADLNGEVTYIAPKANVQSGVVFFPVTVRLEPRRASTGRPAEPIQPSSQALPLKTGMTADVEITTASQENTLILPLRAVHSEGGRTYVERIVDDQVEEIDVELGIVGDTEVEVGDAGGPSSLAEGDLVVVVPGTEQDEELRLPGLFGGGN